MYRGKKLGTIGDVGCFSFFSNKNISTGEGGMLVTGDQAYFEKAKLLRSHGMTSLSYDRAAGHSMNYDVVELGYNYRMDDIRASIGIVQLRKLKNDLIKRDELRNYYKNKLSEIDGIIIPFREYPHPSSNYIFPVVLKDSTPGKRENVRNKLAAAGIQTSVHYPAIHKFSMYKHMNVSLPKTEYVSDNLLTLPMYGSLKTGDIDIIVHQLSGIL